MKKYKESKKEEPKQEEEEKEEEIQPTEQPKLDNDENPERDLELPNAADNYIKLMNEYVDKYNLTQLKQYIIEILLKKKKIKQSLFLNNLKKI